MNRKNLVVTALSVAVVLVLGYLAYTGESISSFTGGGIDNTLAAISNSVSRAVNKGAPNVSVGVLNTPKAQKVVAGSTGFIFTNFVFNAKSSGEDIKIASFNPTLTLSTANTADDLTNCRMYDGQDGISNIINPANTTVTGDVFTFNLGYFLTVKKGTSKTISLVCNVTIQSDERYGSVYQWGVGVGKGQRLVKEGKIVSARADSDRPVGVSVSANKGSAMTLIERGELRITLDSSTPKSQKISCGPTSVPVTKLKLSASYEDVYLKSLNFSVGGTVSPSVLYRLSVRDDKDSEVAEGAFGADAVVTTATISSANGFKIPQNSPKVLTVVVDMVPAGNPACIDGRNFSIGYAGNFEAVGASSGSIMITSYSPAVKGKSHIIASTKPVATSKAIQFDLEVLDKDGKPVSGSVGEYRIKVARSVSGRAMEWSDGFGVRNGESFISINAEPGYYVARLYRSNAVVGEWGSIPVNDGVINLVLQIGRAWASR